MKKLPFIFIPLILLINLATNTVAFYTRIWMQWNQYLNEVFVIGILLLIFQTLFRSSRLDEISITQRLRIALLLVIGLYIAGLIVIALTEPEYQLPRSGGALIFRPNSWTAMMVATLIGAGALIGMALCFRILKTLIFHRQKKNTRLYFMLLVSAGTFTILSTAWSGRPLKFNFDYNHPLTSFFLVPTFFLMIPNLFRVGWVSALNRKQKFLTFLGGLAFIFVSSSLLGAEIAAGVTFADMVNTYSLQAGSFLLLTTIFMMIYSVLVTLNALVHLPTAAIYDKKVREINSIYHMSRAINTVFDIPQIVRAATDLVCEATEADACWLDLSEMKGPETHYHTVALTRQPHFRAPLGSDPSPTPPAVPADGLDGLRHTIIEIIRSSRNPLLINHAKKDRLTRAYKRLPVGSLLAVPMISSDEVVGMLVAVKSVPFGFDQDDIAIMTAFANQTTVSIENARLVQASLEKERLAEELRIAHEVQMRLLPQSIPVLKNVRNGLSLDISAITVPAHEVGGDYYDILPISENHTGIVIADVSGKGAYAAFYMAEIKGIIQALAPIYTSPAELLKAVNRTFYNNIDRRTFITLTYAMADLNQAVITFARAGHCPLIYVRDNECRLIQSGGIGLGLDPGPVFDRSIEEITFPLEPDQLFLMYSDGLPEARNQSGTEYGEEHLCSVLTQHRHLPAVSIRNHLLSDVQSHTGHAKPHDDLTCVVIKTEQFLPEAAREFNSNV